MCSTLVEEASAPGAWKTENQPARHCPQRGVRCMMKRKVEQRETQRDYAHARSNSGSDECYKVRRTGHTLCSAGVPRATLPCSLRPLQPCPLARTLVWGCLVLASTSNMVLTLVYVTLDGQSVLFAGGRALGSSRPRLHNVPRHASC